MCAITIRSRGEGGRSPGIAVPVPTHGCHRLFWNNYPATAFDHDLSNAVEAALPFIRIDSILRDPKGLTCISLHSFTDFFMKCSSAIP